MINVMKGRGDMKLSRTGQHQQKGEHRREFWQEYILY